MKKNQIIMLSFAVTLLLAACSKSHSGTDNNDNSWNGQLPYHTDFNNNADQWPAGNIGGNAVATIQNGSYTITNQNADGAVFSDAPYNFFGQTTSDQDIAIESTLKIVANNNAATEGYGGFSFDYIDTGEYKGQYLGFGIYSDGYFDVYGYSSSADETGTIYKDKTRSSAIKQNDFNTLQIKLSQGKFYFYINGTNVYTMDEPYDDNLDIVSFFADYYSTLQADNFTAEVL